MVILGYLALLEIVYNFMENATSHFEFSKIKSKFWFKKRGLKKCKHILTKETYAMQKKPFCWKQS